MTEKPRWTSVLLTVLALNIAAVVVTSAWRFAAAQETTSDPKLSVSKSPEAKNEEKEDTNQASTDDQQTEESAKSTTESAPSLTVDPTTEIAERLSNLEVPLEDLPEAPADPQLMQSILSEAGISPEYLRDPPSISAVPKSTQSIHGLAMRLETTQQLTESALSLLGEAEAAQMAGDPAQAERFLQMSLRIKEMAAELLRSQ